MRLGTLKRSVGLVALLAIAGCTGEAALSVTRESPSDAETPEAEPATPDAAATVARRVTPDHAFLGRSLRLWLDGFPGTFDASRVELGRGVHVTALRGEPGSSIVVDVTIDADAPLGPRDIRVGDTVLANGFDVRPAIAATFRGSRAQGALLGIELTSLDPHESLGLNPFAVGRDLLRIPYSLFEGDFGKTIVLVAPGAAPGKRALSWASFGTTPPMLSAPDALDVLERAPQPLAVGRTASGPTDRFDTRLYQFEATTPSIATVAVEGVFEPVMWLFDKGGHEEDLLAVAREEVRFRGGSPRVEYDIPVGLAPSDKVWLVGHEGWIGAPDGITTELAITSAAVIPHDGAVHASETAAQKTTGCESACVLTGALTETNPTHVFEVPARPGSGNLTVAIRTAHSAGVEILGAASWPTRRAPWSRQGLSAPLSIADANWSEPIYVRVTRDTAAPAGAEPYRVSVRRTPRTL